MLNVDWLRYLRRSLTVMERIDQLPEVTASIEVPNGSPAYEALMKAYEDNELSLARSICYTPL